jgi:hypothetical protein
MMMSLAEVMVAVKRVAELEVLGVERVKLVKQLEAKVDALETLLSVVMSINRELKLKVDEMFIELDVMSKVEVRVAVVEMGVPINHFGNVANCQRQKLTCGTVMSRGIMAISGNFSPKNVIERGGWPGACRRDRYLPGSSY